ncbi:MAG: GNAT family N-acetyltransferase [Rudanella sp.]|nr:GNAT family N-acetyltransferase [Rudanella sp.]
MLILRNEYHFMHLIELTSEKADTYKAFFTQAVTLQPDFFRISPADEAESPFPTLGTPDSFTLAMTTPIGHLMGVVSFQREGANRTKLRHKGLLFRMYVAAEYAGRGIGRRLVNEVIQRARLLPGMEQLLLTVAHQNEIAKKLYESVGFQSFSLELRAMKYNGAYVDEEQMVLFL